MEEEKRMGSPVEVKDLMIGDWVNYSICLNPDNDIPYEEYIKIFNIYGLDVNCDVRDYEIKSGLREFNLYAIELTKEILEMNGFQNVGDDRDIIMQNDTYLCGVDFSEGIGKFYTFGTDPESDSLETVIKGISTVHQLQHALRMVGLRELADGFVMKK